MIDYPRDERGNPVMFPGAAAPRPSAHREATLQHLLKLAVLDVGYALWQAAAMAKDNPEWHGDLLERLDAALIAKRVKRPAPFIEPECKVPALVKGRRGLPKHRTFHETL